MNLMCVALLWAVIAAIGGVNASGELAQAPQAAISKVFHERRPLKFPPPLLKDVLAAMPVNWSVVGADGASQRAGDYFEIAWNSRSHRPFGLIVRFEYRQERMAQPQEIMVKIPPPVAGTHLTPIA